jgi:hypothetical protein
VLYEGYMLYDLMSACLLAATVFAIAMFSIGRRQVWLCGFMLALNALMLTRSLYHLALLVGAIPLVGLLATAHRFRVMALALLLSVPSLGWYARSQIKFGFFGASSWSDLSLWRIVAKGYSPKELQKLARRGVVDAMAADDSDFRWPREYRQYGFTQESPVAALNRDNFNNINLIAVSRSHRQSALRLMAHDPARYLGNAVRAYKRYCHPASEFRHLEANRARIARWERIAAALQGRFGPRDAEDVSDGYGSFLFFLLPTGLVLATILLARDGSTHPGGWTGALRENPTVLVASCLIAYTTAVGCLFEIGENERFKFIVEQVLWVWLAAVFLRSGERLWNWTRRGRVARFFSSP